MKLALSEITADQRAQPRAAMDVDVVGEYGEDMKRGDKFPPVVVFFDGAKHWLADGFHRYYGAVAGERSKLECEVREGGLADAEKFSCGANASHGLRRTNEDKRRAVFKVFAHPEWSSAEWSTENDHDVAKLCAVTHPFVAKCRKEFNKLNDTGNCYRNKIPFTHSKTGERTTMTLSPRPSQPQEGALSAKSLHEIRRQIGMMPDAVEVVDNFPADQWDRFALSEIEEMAEWLTRLAAAWRARIARGVVAK